MAHRIIISFPADRSHDYYFRVFNWAEELWGEVEEVGFGKLNDYDHARETIWVDVRNRHMARVKQIIKKSLHYHNFDGEYTITIE
jgi:hypothetical protein